MTPLTDDQLEALFKEAQPQGHLPCFGIRRDVLLKLVSEVQAHRERAVEGFELTAHLSAPSRANPLAAAFAGNAKRAVL